MKLLIINRYGKGEMISSDFVPRVGDKVDMFYEPLPTVTSVVWWPSAARIASMPIQSPVPLIQAILTVE